jgi:hypothetical protein
VRAALAILAAIVSLVGCVWWSLWFLAALSSNIRQDHNQSANVYLVLLLALMAWGVVSAVGVFCRREWARRSFIAWAIAFALLELRFDATSVSVGSLLAAWLVGRARTAQRSPA